MTVKSHLNKLLERYLVSDEIATPANPILQILRDTRTVKPECDGTF